MERTNDQVIELGTVSEETKGIPVGNNDTIGGHREVGLSDD